MNDFKYSIEHLINRYPVLSACQKDIDLSVNLLIDCYQKKHKLLVAGNGGSCSDAEHIVGELMKGFISKRPLSKQMKENILSQDEVVGLELCERIQQGLPAIALNNHQSLNSAIINDIENGGLYTYAQQINVLGEKDDVFLAISTSGNAKNLFYASIVAKSKGLKVILLSGKDGGIIKSISDVSIIVPLKETFMIQELHLPIYHYICLYLEERFFGR